MIGLIFAREDVAQFDFQPIQDRLQLGERDVMLAPFNPVKCGVRNANQFRKFRVRKAAPCLSQITCELAVEISFHPAKLTKNS